MPRGKRSHDTLTGGTRDVNPQYINAAIIAPTGAASQGQVNIVLPLSRLVATGNTTSEIIEILKIYWYFYGENGSNDTNYQLLCLSTSQGSAALGPVLEDPHVIAMMETSVKVVGTPANFSQNDVQPYETDLTDGAGHGYLVATEQLWLSMTQTNNASVSQKGAIKILFRYKNVGLTEFYTMIQSQSQ